MTLKDLESIIRERVTTKSKESYTYGLISQGIDRLAQKVGEEAIETVIEAKNEDKTKLDNEIADLMYHLLVLMSYKGSTLQDIEEILEKRHTNR